MLCIHNDVLFSHKEQKNYVTFKKMEGTRDYRIKWKKPDSEEQMFYVFSHMRYLYLKKIWK
jgi:hypothetical protein